jgi:hypothetical protein
LGEIADVGKQVYDSKKHGLKRLEPIAEALTKRVPYAGGWIANRMHKAAKPK